jgi:hypothetical protein
MSEKMNGRMVNPNWAVILENGEEYKYKRNRDDFVMPGLWKTANCNRFVWHDIRKYFTGE